MKRRILATLVAMLVFSVQAIACDQTGQRGILEKNSLYIPVSLILKNGMTEKIFNSTIGKIEAIYKPIVSARGKNLVVERNWDDGTVNAYARQMGSTWSVSMFGGLARHDAITADGFATVVCHEIGHHIGGLPKKKSLFFGSDWAANEGQSDYFATSKCMRKYMENDDNEAILAKMTVPAFVVKTCNKNFPTERESLLCQRNGMASLSLANLFNSNPKGEVTDLSFKTPDTSTVSTTYDNHPAPQCRLDTYWNGALCEKDAYTDVSDRDYTTGTCSKAEGYTIGTRPTCWFKAPRS